MISSLEGYEWQVYVITEASYEAGKVRFIRAQTRYTIRKVWVKTSLQDRILDSAVFNRDIEVGRQEGHQLQRELGLKRQKHWRNQNSKDVRI